MNMRRKSDLINSKTSGTILGIPYQYSLEKDEYTLAIPNGGFVGKNLEMLEEYIKGNIGEFLGSGVGSTFHKSMMNTISKEMEKNMLDEGWSGASTSSTNTSNQDEVLTTEKLTKTLKGISVAQEKVKILDDIRFRLTRENEKIQKDWDMKFNKEVLKLVREAIEYGQADYRYTVPKPIPMNSYSSNNKYIVGAQIEAVTIIYNRDMNTQDAYRDIREQAENAVRLGLKPPQLNKLP